MPVMVYSQLERNQDSKNGRWSSTKATKRIISHMTSEIARLLQPDKPILLRTTEGEKSVLAPLTPRDIAILVRSHKQAEQLQTTLARAGIPAVMASQQSVFASNESHDLFLLMQALSSPGDLTLLKTALTSSWFGMNGPELHALWQDPHQIDNWLDRSHDYHRLWQEQGFLAMMTSLLASEEILLTLAQKPLAERRISNIHHLLELTQTAETEQAMGPAKTLQWLRTMREDSHAMEDTELRLESDEEAVKIVTMHSAKGLEYPVVFCPFLWYRGNYIKQAKGIAICHDKDLELVMDLGSPLFEEHKQKALAEELAEELRLAYVALTRARCRCYLFWADVSANKYIADSMDSALAWLLWLNEDNNFAAQVKILQDRATNSSVACEVIPADSVEPVMMTARGEKGDALVSLVYTADNLYSDWLLHSYSSLTANAPAIPGSHGIRPSLAVTAHPEGQLVVADTAENEDGTDQSPVERGAQLPELPKGPQFGNVVHGLLEDIPFLTLAGGSGYQEALKKQCAWFGVKADPEILTTLLQKVVETPLTLTETGATFCLADLDPAQIIMEMPFYFQLQPSSTGQINSILSGSRTVAPVSPKTLQGYLTGFVDLICCHQGKFYIMDYKSNWLGDHLTDYGAEALEIAMREHNYGLQYWLYTLVLHRYLQSAMSGYDYSAHFGGVMYLFVRGMEPTVPESGVYFDLPDQATLERLDHCLGRSSSVHGASDTGPSLACGRSCAVHGTHDTGPYMACGHSYGGTENE
jgi:exodeoxyribonuclease V beta subunit